MSDDPKHLEIKKGSQVGFLNVEDLELNATWFPVHITTVGSVLGVVAVMVTLTCLWRSCRKKTFLKLFDFFHDCRKTKAQREQDKAIELLELEIAAQNEASTSHHGRHHRGHRGHRHAHRGGHNSGLPRSQGPAIESARHSGMSWTQAEDREQMTKAIKSNLEAMCKMAMPEVHGRNLGARPRDDGMGEDDDNNVAK